MSTLLKLNGVKLPGTGYPNISQFKEIYVSITDGLAGMYSFTEDESKSIINYAGGRDLIKVGSPKFEDKGIKVSRKDHLDTGIMPSESGFTHIIVGIPKKDIPVGDGVFIVGNYFKPGGTGNGGQNSGYALTETGNARWRNYVQTNNVAVVYADMGISALSDTVPAVWGGVTSVGSGDTGGNKVFYGFNNNLAIGNSGNVSSINISGQGSKLIGGHRGPADFFALESNHIQAVLIYNRALSDNELRQVYQDLRVYGSGRGITGL